VRRLRSDSGQSAVELLLLFPFIFTLVLIIVEFGVILFAHVSVRNAASEAARFAAVANLPTAGSCDEAIDGYLSIEERAVETSGGLVQCAEVTVVYQGTSTPFTRGDGVAVHISHEHATVTGLGAFFSWLSWGAFPATWTLNSCSDSRLEQGPDQTPPDDLLFIAGADCS
jgi:Flp pilus assembly protein TadG